MHQGRNRWAHVARQAGSNAVRFGLNLGLVWVFGQVFGAENTLPGVVAALAATLIPFTDYGVRPGVMAFSAALLLPLGALAGQTALLPAWAAFPLNLGMVLIIELMTCEPDARKPAVCFLLAFVFCQATPVPMAAFPRRLAGMALGGAATAALTLFFWRRNGFGREGLGWAEQVRRCARQRGYLARMSLGVAGAMLLAALLGLKKPLWISIVAMSLTQIDWRATRARIGQRAAGTLAGIALFVPLFRWVIPPAYNLIGILAIGYVSFFLPAYPHKQAVNAVNALNASMALMSVPAAVANRLLCLAGGVGIVLLCQGGEALARRLRAAPR
ncbi:MAG: FUSC family protein [Christensenellales bacterium]